MRQFIALLSFLTPERRQGLLFTLLLMLFGAGAEMLTIGAVLPFLALLSAPAGAMLPAGLTALLAQIGGSPVVGAAVVLVAAATLTAALRLYLSWQVQRLVMDIGVDLACAVFAGRLHQPYAEQVQRNTSGTLGDVDEVQRVVNNSVLPAMQAVTSTAIALFIAALLFVIDAYAAATGGTVAATIYLLVSLVTRPPLRRNSVRLMASARERTQMIQEALSGIRDIILDGAEKVLHDRFGAADTRYRRALAATNFLAVSARFPVEAAGVVAFAVAAVAMSLRSGGLAAAIPVLGALALGAQRLLPLLQAIHLAWSQVNGNRAGFAEVMRAASLGADVPPPRPQAVAPLPSFDRLVFEGVSYRHSGGRFAVHDLNFAIAPGEHVGIAGPTGKRQVNSARPDAWSSGAAAGHHLSQRSAARRRAAARLARRRRARSAEHLPG